MYMMNRVICKYCGTIYDADKKQCPLCGSEWHEELQEQPRRRSSEGERRAAPVGKDRVKPVPAKEPKKQKKNPIPRALLIAALFFVALTVLLLIYFTGDMLDWWPGPEDLLTGQIGTQETESPDENETCTYLDILPEEITFTEAGQIQKLRVVMNAGCTEQLFFNSSNGDVVMVSEEGQLTPGDFEQRAITVDVTAMGPGQALITVSCGEKNVICPVTCDFDGTVDTPATEEPTELKFTPVLSQNDLTFFLPMETATLSITNLPEGVEVLWSSSDEEVATVSETGLVTAIGSGTATITADAQGNTVTAIIRCNFEETVETGNHLTHTDVTIKIDEVYYLRLIDAEGNRIDNASYYCEDTSICSVSGAKVTGLSSGTTKIIVTYDGVSYSCIVRVKSA